MADVKGNYEGMVFTVERLYFGLVLWKRCEIDRRETGGMHGRGQHMASNSGERYMCYMTRKLSTRNQKTERPRD